MDTANPASRSISRSTISRVVGSRVVGGGACEPLEGALVDVWHAVSETDASTLPCSTSPCTWVEA